MFLPLLVLAQATGDPTTPDPLQRWVIVLGAISAIIIALGVIYTRVLRPLVMTSEYLRNEVHPNGAAKMAGTADKTVRDALDINTVETRKTSQAVSQLRLDMAREVREIKSQLRDHLVWSEATQETIEARLRRLEGDG